MKNKKRITKILITLIYITSIFLATLVTTKYAATETTSQAGIIAPVTASTVPHPDFTISAQGAVLIETSTGKILYRKNENEKLYPASTTKILTAIIAIEHCKPTDKITASYDAVMSLPSGYSNAAIQPGETLTFQELLDMFLIQSANEIGTIFAEHVSGSVEKFAILMNQKASSIGCKNTNFTNPSGIHDENHFTTAYDMALIAQYCMKNETFRNTVSKPSCKIAATDKYEERYFRNTNDLLNKSSDYYYEPCIGIKTGYTSQAKRCLIAGAFKGDIELISVVLGTPSTINDARYLDTINMFNYGFDSYKIQRISTQNTPIEEIVIENATKDTKNLSLLLKNDLIALMPKNMNLSDVNRSVKLNETIEAPISAGDILGKVTYTVDGLEYSSDLIAEHNVEKFDIKTTLIQIASALLAIFILFKIFKPKKKKSKNKNSKNRNNNKNSSYKKTTTKNRTNYKKYNDSIYKF